MEGDARDQIRERVDEVYRTESRRVLATLIRLLGDFDAAEEALHEAFAAAAEQWLTQGVPDNPYAWLVSAGRFKTIDRWRREARLARALPELAALRAAGRAGGVDEHLPAVLAGARFETWVIGGRDPTRVGELLERGTTAGTRIASARLLRSRDG